MYRTWGNVLLNPNVGLLFVDFEHPDRLRVNGSAHVTEDDPLRAEFPGAVFIVRVRAAKIFPNCPRYIHTMQLVEHSAHAHGLSTRLPFRIGRQRTIFVMRYPLAIASGDTSHLIIGASL